MLPKKIGGGGAKTLFLLLKKIFVLGPKIFLNKKLAYNILTRTCG
jgi:hypothetical protein